MSDDQADSTAPPVTLRSILRSMSEYDRAMSVPIPATEMSLEPIDPNQLKTKVDSIIRVIKEREEYAKRLKAELKELKKREQAARAGVKRLRKYVLNEMQFHKFERLPGHEMALTRRSPPSGKLKILRECTGGDYHVIGDRYVLRTVTYEWDNAAIKDDLLSGKLEHCTFAVIEEPNEWIDFVDANKPQKRKKVKSK